VTAGTYLRFPHFRGRGRLGVLHRGLLRCARDYGWSLEAWAVFSNHYHFVGHSPADEATAASLPRMLGHLHTRTAEWVNRLDDRPGRRVWHNFWETRLTFQKSYLARLHYVHQNPVKHGLVASADLYPWGSAAWFERTATPAQVKTVYSLPIDRLKVYDEYQVPREL
jgi:putative transposase